jgi:chitinase
MATQKPGSAAIDWMNTKYSFVSVPEDLAYKNVVAVPEVTVPVSWSKWSGAGATKVEYLLNGEVYASQDVVATDGTQQGSINLKFTKGGSFKLEVRLVNEIGSTISSNSQQLVIADTLGSHLAPLAMNINASRFPCKMQNKQYQQNSGKVVGAYAVEWSVYRVQGMDYYINNIPGDNITHLFYGFLGIVGPNASFKTENPTGHTTMARIVPGLQDFEVFPPDPWAAYQKPVGTQVNADTIKGCYGELMAFGKRYPHVKKVVSIGGWSLSDPFFFMDVKANRDTFVASVEKYLCTWKFWDGIDLDWEFPGVGGANTAIARSDVDQTTYVKLVQELRVMLDRLGAETGKHYEMTIAINAGYDKVAPMNYGEIAKSLDFINIMSYDFHGAWDLNKLSHHTNVYAPAFRPDDNTTQKYSLRREIDDLVAQGVPKAKLVAGCATYGRGWKGVPAAPGTDVFLGKATGFAGPTGDTQKYWLGAGSIMQAQISEEFTSAAGWEYRYDAQAEAPFIYKQATGELITFDDARSVAAKCAIVMAEGLGGIFNWEMDTDNGLILNAMNDGVGNKLAGAVVPPVDGKPVANAGNDQVVEIGNTVILNGSGSTDPEAKPLAYKWEQVSGQAAVVSNSTSVQATFVAPTVAADTQLVFKLTVTDAVQQSVSDNVTVTVKATVTPETPKALTVTVTPTQNVGANKVVTLAATSDNPNAGTLAYVWKQISGSPVSLTVTPTGNGVQFTSKTAAVAEVLEFEVTVNDGKAPAVVKTSVVNVAANVAPAVGATTPTSVESGAGVTLNGTAVDADGNVLSYAWKQLSGPAVTLANANKLVADFVAPTVTADTSYAFELSVTDGVATAVTAKVTIVVKPKASGGSTLPAYVAGKQYNAGDKVNHGGFDWQANYWTQNVAPSRTVGDWKLLTTGVLPWDASVPYNANDLCTYNGGTYKAAYWTKGDKPDSSAVWKKQ